MRMEVIMMSKSPTLDLEPGNFREQPLFLSNKTRIVRASKYCQAMTSTGTRSTILSVLSDTEDNVHRNGLVSPNRHLFVDTADDEEKKVRFLIGNNVLYPNTRDYVDPMDLSKQGRQKHKARIRKDTQHATKRWLCSAPNNSRFRGDVDKIMKKSKENVHSKDSSMPPESDIDGDDDEDKPFGPSDAWFTKQIESPDSIESHESFWEEQIDDLNHDEEFTALAVFEDDTHDQLRQEIQGTWTRRFVQKRTKPKILNALHRERLSLLLLFMEDNDALWQEREAVYVNLSARVRLHWDSAFQWDRVLKLYSSDFEKISQTLQPAMHDFAAGISQIDGRSPCKTHVVFLTMLRTIFNMQEEDTKAHRSGGSNFKRRPYKPRSRRNSIKHRKPAHTKSETNTVDVDSTADASVSSKSAATTAEPTVDTSASATHDDHDEDDDHDDIVYHVEYPDIEEIRLLIQDLSKASRELSNPMWKTHDSFKQIDQQIENTLRGSLSIYGNDLQENPLVKETTGKFADEMSKILSLLRSSVYCRRRIQAMLLSSYLADYEDVEVVCTDIMLENIMEWVEYLMWSPLFSIHPDEWNELMDSVEENEQVANAPNSDLLNVCAETLDTSLMESAQFVMEELDEVDRLINAQIMCQGPVTLYAYTSIQQMGAFAPMVPTEIPNQIEKAEVGNGALYKIRCCGALLIQGQFYFFETDRMEKVILTVDVNKLQRVHVMTKRFGFELYDTEQVVEFGIMYEEHTDTWKDSLKYFCELD